VVLGLVIVKVTGWLILDPIMALLVALHIAWVAIKLLQETTAGFMDSALPETDQALIWATLTAYQTQGIHFHALRTRVAGARNFVSFHVLVPGDWTVQQGHALCEQLEQAIMRALPGTHVMTHLEPVEDPISWADIELDRSQDHQP
jgi:cation diffusion facilitator family transporter